MPHTAINKSSFHFLKDLSEHNDRDWFAAHKDRYTAAHNNLIQFADDLLGEMNQHDNIETPTGKASLHRIYKDVRFSKDKKPYNTCWNGGFRRATELLRGGYYYHLEPGNSFAGGGFFGPDAADLGRIRQHMSANFTDWNVMLNNKGLVRTFGSMEGTQLATAPRGYEKDHPAIALLRYKQFLLRHTFTDEEVLAPDFARKLSDIFKAMRPFLDFMSDVLTTDANGVCIV